MTIVWIWVANVIYAAAVISAALLWAVRTKQFSDMDRPRHFALDAEPLDDASTRRRSPGRLVRYAWAQLLLDTAALFAVVLVLGIRMSPGVKPWSS